MVRGTVGFAVNRLVDAVIGLLLVPFTLHRLGSEAYGLWALFYAVTSYFNLADLGFGASLNRHLTTALTAKDDDQKYCVFSTGFFFFAAFSLLLFLVGIAVEPWIIKLYPEVVLFGVTGRWVWRAMVIVLALGYLSNYARALMIASHRADRLAILHILIGLLNAAMVVLVLSLGWGLLGLAWGSAIFGICRLVLFYTSGIGSVPSWKVGLSGIRRQTLQTMWKFGITVQVARIADMINMQFDRVFLGRVLGLGSVTHYDIGAKAASSGNMASQVTLYVIEPAAAALTTQGDKERFTELLQRSGKYVALLTMPIGVILGVLAEPLLTLWLGSLPDARIVFALRMLIGAYLIGTITQPLRLCARGAGFPGWEAKTAGMQAILNVGLSIGLYFQFGFAGVLAGTLIAALAGQLTFTRIALSGLQQPIWRFFKHAWLGPLSISIVAGLATVMVKILLANRLQLFHLQPGEGRLDALPLLIVCAMVFGIVYVTGTWGLRIVTVSEIRGLIDRLKKRTG